MPLKQLPRAVRWLILGAYLLLLLAIGLERLRGSLSETWMIALLGLSLFTLALIRDAFGRPARYR